MALPDRIAIQPLATPPRARISIPGSKSETNRALILAALSSGQTTLKGALWSEDTQVMTEQLKSLGFSVVVEEDPSEPANRTLTVQGLSGDVPEGGTRDQPLELFVANAGTAARFLSALVCLGSGWYRLDGVARMRERPQGGLFRALRDLGYRVESPNERLPVLIGSDGPCKVKTECVVDVQESSQFASALYLCAKQGNWSPRLSEAENNATHPYIEMTLSQIRDFPSEGGEVEIEPDASSASYFWAMDTLFSSTGQKDGNIELVVEPNSSRQIDSNFKKLLPLPNRISRETDLGDSIMTAMALAPFKSEPTLFTDLQRLRVQECERVVAMREELSRMGARVEESGETLTVYPSALKGAEIETYNDHRMAMCFAVLGLKVPGVILKNPACVIKTFPNFFQKLASPAPMGLGAEILDPDSGRVLGLDQLEATAD